MLKFRDKLYGVDVEDTNGTHLGKCVNVVLAKDNIYFLSVIEPVKMPSFLKTFLFRFPLIGLFAKPLLKRGRRYYFTSFLKAQFVESNGQYKIVSDPAEEPKEYICFLHPDYGAPKKYKAVIATPKSSDMYFLNRPILKLETDVAVKAKLYFRKEVQEKESREVVMGHAIDLLINEQNKKLVVWLSTQAIAPYEMIDFWNPVVVYGDGEGFFMQFLIACLACDFKIKAKERPVTCPKCNSKALSVVEF